MVKSKSIYATEDRSDGIRIAVLSGTTKVDGITDDSVLRELVDATCDISIKELAPPRKLLGDYYKRGLSWEHYEKRYREHILSSDKALRILSCFINITIRTNVDITFVCIENTPDKCHRRILVEICKELAPHIETKVM